MEDKMKWAFAALAVGFVGYAVRGYVVEAAKVAEAARRPRQPWERL
jgi:hypothetical protein